MPDPTPTVAGNAEVIATIRTELVGVTTELRRINDDLRSKDGNIWASHTALQKDFQSSRTTNWQLILGAMTLVITVVVLWGNTTTAPINQKLDDLVNRMAQTWTAQGETGKRLTADEIAAAKELGRQEGIKEGRQAERQDIIFHERASK